MTHSDPSSPLEDDALDFLAESLDSPDPEQTELSRVAPDSSRDEDRLYTDEFIRQNERSSRTMFLSFICAGVICAGVGVWYLVTRSQQPQPTTPLQVPEQPSLTLPNSSPGATSLPTKPLLPGQSLPPTDSGVMPGDRSGSPTGPILSAPSKTGVPGSSTPPPPPQ
jgi:hypothetical protein